MATTYLTDMSAPRRAYETVGGPVIAGALCGAALQVNAWLYALLVLVSLVGGIPAGTQHRTLGGAAARGATNGLLWAAALLLTNELLGDDPQLALLSPKALLLVVSTVITVAVSMTAHLISRRSRARAGLGPAA